jgi:predicted AlkP superfamily pyrophosphatase or phosphodiesterase
MKRFLFSFFFLLPLAALFAQTKKAVFIIIDGVPHDVIEKLSLPHFGAIASEGGFAKAIVGGEKGGYSQTPTISAVGYNSVLTGTWVNKHNVWDNDIAAPNYAYPTIFRLLKESDPQKKTAIFSSWLDNRTKLVGEGKPETGGHFFDYHLDSLEYDTLNFPHDKGAQYMHRIDQRVTEEAAKVIREEAPDLTWVYLEFTDDMGHRYGDSPQYYEAVKAADEKLGRIWEAIQYRKNQFGEDWLLVALAKTGCWWPPPIMAAMLPPAKVTAGRATANAPAGFSPMPKA